MKTVVFADIHHRTSWVEHVLADERPDRTVFLGDFFDATGKSGRRSVVCRVVDFAKRMLNRDDVIWLMGNHDAQYLLPNRSLRCGRAYDFFTHKTIQQAITLPERARIKFAHIEQGWLLSHAGLREGLIDLEKGFSPEWLAERERQVSATARLGAWDPWLACGWARGGYGQPGVLWQDWDMEFVAVPGVNQIVGHTRHPEPDWKVTQESRNLCLDCDCGFYAVIENGEVTTRPNPYPIRGDAKPYPRPIHPRPHA